MYCGRFWNTYNNIVNVLIIINYINMISFGNTNVLLILIRIRKSYNEPGNA